MPTCTVELYDGTTRPGSASLSPGSPDVATFQIASLAVGSHAITAFYEGDSNFQGSTSSALNQAVSYGVKQAAVANAAGKLAAAVQLQGASGNNLSSSRVPMTALRIVDSNSQTVKTLNAPFTLTTAGPAGFVGGVYIYATSTSTSTSLPRGTYSLVYQAGTDPTTHSMPFSF